MALVGPNGSGKSTVLRCVCGIDTPTHAADRVLRDAGLIQQALQLPGTLSTGQRHRLALATAFVRPRKLLVVDEPEQHLDEPGLEWLAERLNVERADGLAVLLASRDTSLVNAVADDVTTLSQST